MKARPEHFLLGERWHLDPEPPRVLQEAVPAATPATHEENLGTKSAAPGAVTGFLTRGSPGQHLETAVSHARQQ